MDILALVVIQQAASTRKAMEQTIYATVSLLQLPKIYDSGSVTLIPQNPIIEASTTWPFPPQAFTQPHIITLVYLWGPGSAARRSKNLDMH